MTLDSSSSALLVAQRVPLDTNCAICAPHLSPFVPKNNAHSFGPNSGNGAPSFDGPLSGVAGNGGKGYGPCQSGGNASPGCKGYVPNGPSDGNAVNVGDAGTGANGNNAPPPCFMDPARLSLSEPYILAESLVSMAI